MVISLELSEFDVPHPHPAGLRYSSKGRFLNNSIFMRILGDYFGLSVVPSQNTPQNTHKPTSEIGFSRRGLCVFSRLFSRLFLIFRDDSQVSSTDSFTDSS